MAMERQDYPAMLPQLQPPQAVHILNNRVAQVGQLNTGIADWLRERRQIEEQYASGLRKLARRQFDGVDLGIFSVPWTTILGSADTIADSHSALAAKIEVDVERPLREFASTSREMSAMSTIQGNLDAMAKEVERAQQKTDKLRGKGDKAEANKVASTNADLDAAQTQWESQAPYVFENLQALDEARLDHLQAVLTQLQTLESDQTERSRVSAEQCLNVLLNMETKDEITTFALKAVQSKPSMSRAQRSSLSQATPSRAPQPLIASASTPSIAQQDEQLGRERSGSLQEEKQKGRFKGLKRLGTVVGRKRESKMPSTLPSTSESPERKSRPSPFRFGRSRDGGSSNLDSMQETSRERPGGPYRLGSEILEPSSEMRAEPATPTPATLNSHVNGTSLAAGAAVVGGAALGAGAIASSIPNGSHQGDLADLQPPKPVERDIATPPVVAESQKDSEGFSVPPQHLDPISQAQQEAAAALEGNSPQYNVNIRDAPIQEEGVAGDAALASAANKLQAPPPASRRTSTIRGRRQDRNSAIGSTYIPPDEATESVPQASSSATKEAFEPPPIQTDLPAAQTGVGSVAATTGVASAGFGQLAASTFSPFSSTSEQQLPFRPDSRATPSLDQGRTDTQSIRSATTTGSQGGNKHPELNETGLNSSIIETVSARFENGKILSSSLIGEIALTYNPADFSSPFGNENIRLDNFASLEKVAPNPAFITQTSEKEGEYSVNLSSLGKAQVAFKYQIRLDDAGSQAPLLITPAFKVEENQFSAIISYSLNSNFALHGRERIILSNVMLAFTIDGSKATGCQSRPQGHFSREKNMIYWQLNDVTLTPGAAPTKLLARFATESEAKAGSVDARWEISSDNAQDLGSGLSLSMHSQPAASDGSDPFADESVQAAVNWKPVSGMKKLTSGTYQAK